MADRFLVGVYAVEFPPGCGKYSGKNENVFCYCNRKTGGLGLYPGINGDRALRGKAKEYVTNNILEQMPEVIKRNIRNIKKYPL